MISFIETQKGRYINISFNYTIQLEIRNKFSYSIVTSTTSNNLNETIFLFNGNNSFFFIDTN